MFRTVLTTALGALLLLSPGTHAHAELQGPIRIQLKWTHQFQFAGYYAAVEQGFFREAGLEVELVEGGPDINPTQRVLAGEAEFGIGTSGLVVTRSHGHPVVAVAAIFQHSPYILIARPDEDLRTPADLEGRRVMVEPYAEELTAYLIQAGVDWDAIEQVAHSGDPLDIYEGDTVAMTAYTTTEPFILDGVRAGYRVFDPKIAGIDFYGDTLYTTEAFADGNEDTVVALRDAVVRGWLYALRNQDEVIDLIEREYPSPLTRAHLRFEADEIRRLLIPDLVEIGYMNPLRWQHILDEFAAAGMLEGEVDLDAFLYEPAAPVDWNWVYRVTGASALLLALLSALLLRYYRMSRSLQAEILARRELEEQLHVRAMTDGGTGVLNRRGFLETANREIHRSERTGGTLCMLLLDLDRFKEINDTHGHHAGDRVLAAFTATCQGLVRDMDVIGRIGGEEFAILLPGCPLQSAEVIAERIRRAQAADDGEAVSTTVSIGVVRRQPGEDLDALLQRADRAMYEAKRQGRDRVVAGD